MPLSATEVTPRGSAEATASRTFRSTVSVLQIAAVDADDARARIERPFQFLDVVHLDERRESELLRPRVQIAERRDVQGAHDQQDRVRAERHRLEQLILGDDEILAQYRQPDRLSRGAQVPG